MHAIITEMIFNSRLDEAWARLPDYLGSHVLVSLTALAIGLGISLPTAIASRRRPFLRTGLLAIASVVQTIPGLALLALFYPLLLAFAALSERVTGKGFSALGFLPSVLALALYSMLPVLRNTVTGLNGVDPRLSEAARVIGMRPWRLLGDIELPLALPVIMAGIRTSAVWVIGTATLATPIGQTSLGNYIFTGLQTQNWVFVVFGCVAAALFALAVDQLLALVQVGVTRRSGLRTTFRHFRSCCFGFRRIISRPFSTAGKFFDRRQDIYRTIRSCSAYPTTSGGERPYGFAEARSRLQRPFRCDRVRRD